MGEVGILPLDFGIRFWDSWSFVCAGEQQCRPAQSCPWSHELLHKPNLSLLHKAWDGLKYGETMWKLFWDQAPLYHSSTNAIADLWICHTSIHHHVRFCVELPPSEVALELSGTPKWKQGRPGAQLLFLARWAWVQSLQGILKHVQTTQWSKHIGKSFKFRAFTYRTLQYCGLTCIHQLHSFKSRQKMFQTCMALTGGASVPGTLPTISFDLKISPSIQLTASHLRLWQFDHHEQGWTWSMLCLGWYANQG